ncbi:MAG: cupin domain-containing protein [Acidimicrobiales bacterium]|nr:cupin domain-containing protein [Acidimicrobiales bacterium]
MSGPLGADVVAELLGLVPLPGEGGRWAQTLLDGDSSAIHYLLTDGDFSAMHRLAGPEVYHHYAGAPAALLLLFPDGSAAEVLMGDDLVAGQRPQVVVPAGVWQGSSTRGEWTLLGTTMAPPYADEGFELGRRDDLVADWPSAAERIAELTRG